MNKSEIPELIKNGENSKVEFKDERSHPDVIAKTLVAFANSGGGILLIGVDDNKNIIGISSRDKFQDRIMNISQNNCSPSLIPFFEQIEIDNKLIAIITIPKQEGTVYRTNDGHYYIRAGSTSRDATPNELGRLYQKRELMHYDITPVYGTSILDIDEERVYYYFSKMRRIEINKEINIEKLLTNIKALITVENKLCLTVAGLLIFGKTPENFLPQTGIIAIKFRSMEMDYNSIDKKEIIGPLINKYNNNGGVESYGVIEQAIQFVRDNTPVFSKMEGVTRIDTPQYPIESIRESIANAVSHRDYTISGSKIRLFIFSDRIEIRSPGKLPNTISVENIRITAHYTRNPVLYNLLSQFGYVDHIGMGIPQKIIKKMKDHTGIEPKFEEVGEEFVITLFGKTSN